MIIFRHFLNANELPLSAGLFCQLFSAFCLSVILYLIIYLFEPAVAVMPQREEVYTT